MTGKAWMSNLLSSGSIGNKQGLRAKFYGHDWNPAQFKIPLSPQEVLEAGKRYTQGFPLDRKDFPEAAAVWDVRSFKRVRDIFSAGGFYIVRGKLAEVLSRFDLGDGGLVPFPIYKADLATPYPGEFFLLNFGCRKNSLLPELSPKISRFVVEKATGKQHWKVDDWVKEPVALSEAALDGPDLWAEEVLYNKLFLSDALAKAIAEIGMTEVFELEECRIVECAR